MEGQREGRHCNSDHNSSHFIMSPFMWEDAMSPFFSRVYPLIYFASTEATYMTHHTNSVIPLSQW